MDPRIIFKIEFAFEFELDGLPVILRVCSAVVCFSFPFGVVEFLIKFKINFAMLAFGVLVFFKVSSTALRVFSGITFLRFLEVWSEFLIIWRIAAAVTSGGAAFTTFLTTSGEGGFIAPVMIAMSAGTIFSLFASSAICRFTTGSGMVPVNKLRICRATLSAFLLLMTTMTLDKNSCPVRVRVQTRTSLFRRKRPDP